MLVVDIVFYVLTIILYFVSINQIADILFGDDSFQDKQKKKFTFFVVIGLVGIVGSRFLGKKRYGINNKYLSNGVAIASKLLILNAVIMHWQFMTPQLKLSTTLVCLALVGYYSYKYTK